MENLHAYDLASVFITLEQLGISIDIKRYMEIGVQDGNSTLGMLTRFPNAKKMVLCDNWGPGHGGTNRGNHNYVENRIRNSGYTGELVFLDGDSRERVPRYFSENPSEYFDLMVVDDDHSVPTLWQHLSIVLGFSKADIIACHDLCMDGLMNVVTLQLLMPGVGQQYALVLDALTLSKWGIFIKR